MYVLKIVLLSLSEILNQLYPANISVFGLVLSLPSFALTGISSHFAGLSLGNIFFPSTPSIADRTYKISVLVGILLALIGLMVAILSEVFY